MEEETVLDTRVRVLRWLIWICVVSIPVSCRQAVVNDINACKGRSANEWESISPNGTDSSTWREELDRSQWELAPAANELEAEALLGTTAAVALSDDQIAKLVPGKRAKGQPFLVRGIGTRWGTGGFHMRTNSLGELWVAGGALSHRTVPIERRAIVVWLERAPPKVYVTFHVVE
jgi:hypothetical protein